MDYSKIWQEILTALSAAGGLGGLIFVAITFLAVKFAGTFFTYVSVKLSECEEKKTIKYRIEEERLDLIKRTQFEKKCKIINRITDGISDLETSISDFANIKRPFTYSGICESKDKLDAYQKSCREFKKIISLNEVFLNKGISAKLAELHNTAYTIEGCIPVDEGDTHNYIAEGKDACHKFHEKKKECHEYLRNYLETYKH